MDAKELRIGNWVNAILPNKPWRVDDLVIYHMVKGNIQSVYDPSPVYEPIPLTPEILEKAGFVSIEDEFHLKMPRKNLNISIDAGDYSFAIYDTDESYRIGRYHASLISNLKLHQLQNLYFALTGEELPIEL